MIAVDWDFLWSKVVCLVVGANPTLWTKKIGPKKMSKQNKKLEGRPSIADVNEKCRCGYIFKKKTGVMRNIWNGEIIICESCNHKTLKWR